GGGSRLPNQVWLNRPRLADPSGMRTITIDDTQTTSPFDQIVLKGAGVLSVKVALDDAAKGDFVPATLASGGFSDPVDGWYSSTPGSTASAQAALRQLVFAPARNRVPVGSTEATIFTLVISDETSSNTNRESVVISISANDPPVAGHDVGAGFTTTELESFTMADVLGNDVDPDPADSLSVVGLTPLDALGSIADLGNGVFRYDPGGKFNSLPAGQSATDAFAYIVQDANGGTASGLVTITIIGVNQPPVASDAVVTVNENSGANVITPLLLAGATDPDAGDKANLTIATIDAFGTHGQVQLLTGDVLLYSPDGAFPNLPAGATASDSFGFTITDGHGGFSTARANITVVGVNDPPAAGMASFTISEHSGQTNITAGLFAAASDADPGETATLRLVAIDPSAAIGSVTFSNGIVTYSPAGQLRNLAQGQIGVDTLSYSVQDAQGDLSIGVAQVNIVGENDPPLPTPAFITVEDGSGPVDLTSALLAPVIDPDQGETATLRISALVETNLSAGPVLLESGIVTYRPPSLRLPAGQFVTNGFSYAVTDVHGASSNGVCVIYIVGVNTPPVADPAQFSLNEDQVLEGIVTGTDADGDSLAFSLVTGPVHGALVLETNGVFRFTPPADFSGAESFRFVANDGQMDSEPATVSFSILPVNDPPSFVPGMDQTVAEDAGAQVVQTWATAIRTGPADEADQALLFLLEADNPLLFADQPALDAEGTLTFTPAPNAHGSALVTVVLTDDGGTVHGGQDTSASQSFRITVTPVNDPPTLVLDTASRTVQHSDPVAPVTVAAQDVDSPGANLALAVSWNFNGGTFMSGLPPGLTLTQGTILDQQRTWTLAGEAQAPPGVFKVRFMVTDDGDLQGAGDLDVVVEPEDARATFTGTLFASTAAINSGAATVTLAATIRDITAVPGDPAHDPVAGDIRNARVTFINRDNNAILASNLPVGLVAANDPTTGTVVFDWNVDLGAATSQSFTIGTVVHGHHTRDSAEENTVVTVSRPLATDFASGGGSLVLVRPAGLVPGGIGTKMNFGFNVKYKKKGQGLQGNINIIVRNDGRVYEIKGTTMTSLSVSGSRATFNGRAGIQDITNPEAPVGIDGDATLQIKMTDFGEPGSSDSIGVTVWNAEGGLWFASHWDGIRTVEQTIAGGNLVVRSGAAKGGAAPATMAGSGSSFGSDAPSLSISRVVATDELDGFREASPEMNCIQFQAVIGADYAVERSIDLHQWTHLATVTTYTGEIMFFDDTACPENRRFYRVRRLTPPTKGSDPVLLQGATDATTGPTWPPADKPAS
ncbi:MAG TPA: hypothetical protein DCY13_03485, partial [Verrucomicrobiales bacterium]|nr:hypothetical protein [Verrucomicrobiales bacterium]